MSIIINKVAAGNWEEVTLPNGQHTASIQARTAVDVSVDLQPGAHNTFFTVKSGSVKTFTRGSILFVKATNGTVIEIELS